MEFLKIKDNSFKKKEFFSDIGVLTGKIADKTLEYLEKEGVFVFPENVDNIGNRDYLQILAYMFRFDAKVGFFLYPETKGKDDLKLWMNRGTTYEENVPRDDIAVIKHGLKIPVGAADYNEFAAKMKDSEQEFKQIFADV